MCRQMLRAFWAWIEEQTPSTKTPLLIAHNAHTFDCKRLKICGLRNSIPQPDNFAILDTLKIARPLLPNEKRDQVRLQQILAPALACTALCAVLQSRACCSHAVC